jgi:hypothetical protein
MRRHTRSRHVIWDTVDGITRLCDTRNGEFFEINATAALIWSLCEDRTTHDLAASLGATFPDHDKDSIAADTANILFSLAQSGLLDIRED